MFTVVIKKKYHEEKIIILFILFYYVFHTYVIFLQCSRKHIVCFQQDRYPRFIYTYGLFLEVRYTFCHFHDKALFDA